MSAAVVALASSPLVLWLLAVVVLVVVGVHAVVLHRRALDASVRRHPASRVRNGDEPYDWQRDGL